MSGQLREGWNTCRCERPKVLVDRAEVVSVTVPARCDVCQAADLVLRGGEQLLLW